MPWTAKEFASRHNKKLHGVPAAKAASMANAMIRSGTDEGIAIATANKHANSMRRNTAHHSPGEPKHAEDHGEGRLRESKVNRGHRK